MGDYVKREDAMTVAIQLGKNTWKPQFIKKRVMEIPSADVVKVVRCKKCKYWEKLNYEAPKQGWCNDPTPYCDGRWTNADDYCSYGERREL